MVKSNVALYFMSLGKWSILHIGLQIFIYIEIYIIKLFPVLLTLTQVLETKNMISYIYIYILYYGFYNYIKTSKISIHLMSKIILDKITRIIIY